MNFYPEQLRHIADYCQALNAIDGKPSTDGAPFAKEVPLTDGDGVDWGVLRDEIGVSWSWFPPKGSE